jgi:hypothetical protein
MKQRLLILHFSNEEWSHAAWKYVIRNSDMLMYNTIASVKKPIIESWKKIGVKETHSSA